jgi:hypothetical protein
MLIIHLFGHAQVGLTTTSNPPTVSSELVMIHRLCGRIRDARLVLGDATISIGGRNPDGTHGCVHISTSKAPNLSDERAFMSVQSNVSLCDYSSLILHDQLVGARLIRREDPRSVFSMTDWTFPCDIERVTPVSSINFAMQHQAQTNWCWAAVSSSVATFYDAASTWTQCKVVNAELGLADCCTNGSSAACNKPWYLDRALTRVGHFDTSRANPIASYNIDSVMSSNTPPGIRVQWADGGGHVLAVSGHYISGAAQTDYVTVVDPWYGKSDVTYDTLCKQYQGSGTWTHTYYTKA